MTDREHLRNWIKKIRSIDYHTIIALSEGYINGPQDLIPHLCDALESALNELEQTR